LEVIRVRYSFVPNDWIWGINRFLKENGLASIAFIFQPKNIAENLQKQGGFIPGIRPGNQTAQYLSSVIYRITFAGAFFLSIIAVFPFAMQNITGIKTLAIGGTGILIIVSVTLEFVRALKAQLVMRSYEDIAI